MQGGWGLKNLEIALPISPTLCFYASESVDSHFVSVGKEAVRAINSHSVLNATDEVYTPNANDDVASLMH